VRRLAPLLLPLFLLACLPSTARGGEPTLTDLHVEGPLWRADNVFAIDWTGIAVEQLNYRFLNVPWAPDPVHAGAKAETRTQLQIPLPPGGEPLPTGEYQLELWLSMHGKPSQRGPTSYLTLRYDVTPPPPPQASVTAAWVDGRGIVPVSIAPAGAPPSGIGGYAVSLTAQPGQPPCLNPNRCSDAELDFRPGAGGGQLALGQLPEGVDYLNVVAVSGSGVASAPTSVAVHVDASAPSVSFAGIPGGWVDHPVAVTAIAEDRFSGMALAGPTGPLTAIAIDGGAPTTALGNAAAATVIGEGTHLVSGWARDGLGNGGDPAAAATAAVRIDETPPRLAFATAQRPEDPELIEVAIGDSLSGPSASRGSVAVRATDSSQRFVELPTRATASGLAARWNSDDFPPGTYEFRATGYDAAGNAARTERRADGAAMILRNPIKLPTAIDSGFGGAELIWQHCHRVDGDRRRCQREAVTEFESRPAVRTVPYGRALRFGGVLRSTAGAPLAGLPVEVVETFAPGTDVAQRRTTVTSRANGRFEARLVSGPSRRIEAFFAGTRTLTRSSGRSVTMAVRSGVRFRASTAAARIGGEPVVFFGRLFAGEATIPRTGRPIQIEFRLPGGPWSEFRTVQTDRHGRFRYPYAFTDDDSRGIRFQFRAVSPEQSDFPYRPSASPPVAVTGY
jgi:hypothetical protein